MIIENISYIITFIFLLVILSYYILLFKKDKPIPSKSIFKSITVIIPAHNEERYIKDSIQSVLSADFDGDKEIILIDDGSVDNTYKIANEFKKYIKIIQTKHSGKSASMNKALKIAKGEIIAVVDGDSEIKKDSLLEISRSLSQKGVVAATGVVRVKNRDKFINMWTHMEQLYNTLIRGLFSKINANVVTPGPLSAYNKKALLSVGGFSTQGFSEDMDVTIKLIRNGGHAAFNGNAIAYTNMPYELKWFFMQRTRFARGLVNLLKRHLKLNNKIIDIYTLPLFLFGYIQAIVMGSFTIYQIISGYMTYFFSKGIIFDLGVGKFLLEWFSMVGFVKWSYSVFSGATPLTFIAIVGITSTLLTYPLFIFAVIKYDKRIDLRHIIPLFFMTPFWLLIMGVYIISLPEYFKKKQFNIWKKYE